MVYVPSGAKITDKVCIVEDNKYYNADKSVIIAIFSSKIMLPPVKTVAIMTNEFSGPFVTSNICQSNSSFYSWLTVENAIKSNLNPKLKINLRHWALNEIFIEGLVEKGGKIISGVKFVAVTYGQYSTLVLKGGAIYKKILNL